MLRGFFEGIINIIYPKICLSCRRPLKEKSGVDNFVCNVCYSQIKRNLPPFCACCGRHLEKKQFARNLCPDCIRARPHFDRAFSPCVYDGVIKELIHQFKYNSKDYLGTTLSRFMVDFIKEYDFPMEHLDAIVPVPLHKIRLREREFNQAQILSNHLAREFKKDLVEKCLMRRRYTRTQTELEPHQRLVNVKGSFSVINEKYIKGKNILLVDDVLTTGATSSEAASTLKEAGAHIVFVLTLAN